MRCAQRAIVLMMVCSMFFTNLLNVSMHLKHTFFASCSFKGMSTHIYIYTATLNATTPIPYACLICLAYLSANPFSFFFLASLEFFAEHIQIGGVEKQTQAPSWCILLMDVKQILMRNVYDAWVLAHMCMYNIYIYYIHMSIFAKYKQHNSHVRNESVLLLVRGWFGPKCDGVL